jgi:UDP-N-acetylmuramoyl-tripeptide--D-alanyl-D-alanine ligase
MLRVEEIIEATGGELLSGNPMAFKGVSIDSRTISEGELFFAIRGDKFDGHKFIGSALLRGSGAVVDKRPAELPRDKVIICVKDTLRSLQDLAHFLRKRMDVPVVAITGSNGKTTAKEMLHSILSTKFRTLKNKGNFNNHIGLPLSLMRLSRDDEAVVVEMGMNAPGEIRRLCEIAEPGIGVITNVGSAHVGRLGSYEAVRDAKLEIIEGLNTVVVNADDRSLMEGFVRLKFKGKVITFAIENDADVKAGNVRGTEKGSDLILDIKGEGSVLVSLNVYGYFNVYNALAAAASAFSLGMTIAEIKAALESFMAFSMRFEVLSKNGITVINDAYNANPSSMEEALKELMRMGVKGRTIAVLGDMKEMGEFSGDAHREIGRIVSDMGIDVFVAVGEKMELAADESIKTGSVKVYKFRDADEAGKNIMDVLKRGDMVLIKGSRMMSMEKVIGGIADAV